MKKAEKIILVGGSAGSYDLIKQIIATTPHPITFAICIILHRTSIHLSKIERTLSKKFNRAIVLAENNMDIKENHIYFAQPGFHLLVEPNYTFALSSTEPVNYSRPSIDILYETCARTYKTNCQAFLLSGGNADGARGLKTVREYGGDVFVQHPEDAIINTMPNSAIHLSQNVKKLYTSEIIKYFSTLI